MRENKKLILGLIVFFILLISSIIFLAYRLYSALENTPRNLTQTTDEGPEYISMNEEQDSASAAYDRQQEAIEDLSEEGAKSVVESRADEQKQSLDQIEANNQYASTGMAEHSKQSSVAYSTGIYGLNNFVNQYDADGTIENDVVYTAYYPLTANNMEQYVNGTGDRDYKFYISDEHTWYATVINPRASYSTLRAAGYADIYDSPAVGEYPQAGSNQVMISLLVAANLCSIDDTCSIVDDLIGSEQQITLSGTRSDGSESQVTANVVISGIYNAANNETDKNDIVLAYDGLNESDTTI